MPSLRGVDETFPTQDAREIFLPLGQRTVSKQRVQRLCSASAQRRARKNALRGFQRGSEAAAFGEGQSVIEVPTGLGSGRMTACLVAKSAEYTLIGFCRQRIAGQGDHVNLQSQSVFSSELTKASKTSRCRLLAENLAEVAVLRLEWRPSMCNKKRRKKLMSVGNMSSLQ